ncbi:MAG: AzlC family ABC transporter permease [Oscillospiraceae bacterium]|nr:AzlC family ABC transporter permease [Oscillospiraceae bacterium]
MKTGNEFLKGSLHGLPIALGYLSVSFGFGIMAVRSGLTASEASVISLSCLTSAGQVAGVDVIASHGTLIDMILVQIIINIRYSLMALSLSQKLDERFTLPHRMLAAYGLTDEIFAVCYARDGKLRPFYMYGVIVISALGWVAGTFPGAALGEILPPDITAALGILLYGIFIAIIVPKAKKLKSVLFVVCLAALISIGCRFLYTQLSSGFTVIISALIASTAGALLFPRPEEADI